MNQTTPTANPGCASVSGGDRLEPTIALRAGPLRWSVRKALAGSELQPLFAEPDRFLSDPALLIANSPLITLGKIPPSGPGRPTLLLRRLNYGRWRHRARDIFRVTRAERAFAHGLMLESVGISTPRHLAAGVDRCCRWPRRAYLLTEWVQDAISLEHWLQRHHGLPRSQLYLLADLLARLHQHGFSHRDLKASNLLFDASKQPCLIDLDGVRHYRRLSEARAAADLTRFGWEFARYPKWFMWNGPRFLERYCRQRGLQGARRRLEREILEPITGRLEAGRTRWK